MNEQHEIERLELLSAMHIIRQALTAHVVQTHESQWMHATPAEVAARVVELIAYGAGETERFYAALGLSTLAAEPAAQDDTP